MHGRQHDDTFQFRNEDNTAFRWDPLWEVQVVTGQQVKHRQCETVNGLSNFPVSWQDLWKGSDPENAHVNLNSQSPVLKKPSCVQSPRCQTAIGGPPTLPSLATLPVRSQQKLEEEQCHQCHLLRLCGQRDQFFLYEIPFHCSTNS